MAHQITKKSDGTPAYAYIADMGEAWHGLGTSVERTDAQENPAEIFEAAGFIERRIERAFVMYRPERDAEPVLYPDRVVLIDSVTRQPLEVVSASYKRHQPEEIAEFFVQAFGAMGLLADSVGILRDGSSYFASATIGESIRVIGKDTIRPNVLVRTAADGSGATDFYNVVTRTVCANTEAVAIAETPNGLRMRYPHRSAFNPRQAVVDLQAAIAAARAEVESFKELTQTGLSPSTAADVIAAVMAGRRVANGVTPKQAGERTRRIRTSAQYASIMRLYAGDGKGSTLPGVAGTAWGLFNAVTEFLTHHATAKSDGHRFDSNLSGRGADLRGTVRDLLLSYGRQDADALSTIEAAAAVE